MCESARCPNQGQCWGQGVATFMILGDLCTRACRFCAVKAGRPESLDIREPGEVALAVRALNLRYVVVTSVTRDDLDDGGAGQFAETVRQIKKHARQIKIEVLIPDFKNNEESLKKIGTAEPDVIGHNLETVRRLSLKIRPQASYDRSLDVLRNMRKMSAAFIKSSLMVGLGETEKEVREAMKDLLSAGCDLLTIGQYLAPTREGRHVPVSEFIAPEKFREYSQMGKDFGFKYVESGPLVRSSYLAERGYRAVNIKDIA